LGPTRALLAELGDPQLHFATVHVGGTNGKGSVAVLVAEALRAAGRRVGLYTSPHLVDVRERMLVDARPIPADAFVAWTERLRPFLDPTGASFFEATTAIAFADFAARGADIAVVEVGLGGRLDATNVVTPLVSGVTHVAFDHTEYLGSTLEAIAEEKAGIAKPGVPFVVGEPDTAIADLLVARAEGVCARPVRVPPAARYVGPLALRGPHQRRNAAIAEAILSTLPAAWRPAKDELTAGFARARLPGRFDRRGRWLFDVAHNPDGLAALLAALAVEPPPGPLHAVVCVLRDKDWRAMVAALAGAVDRLWFTDAPSAPPDRRWDPAAAAALVGPRAVVERDLARALDAAARGAGTVLVTGSFHTVGDAMARLPGFRPLG
jgi:dihydrofolate synthase / folylpolyglutamate synthase